MNQESSQNWLHKVYGASDATELKQLYDNWAEDYDSDLQTYGYRYPAVLAGLAGRHLDPEGGPVLDAGAGTGLIGEMLAILGFSELVGIDMSDGMLAVAQRKGVYSRLDNMTLGEHLDFADSSFAAVVSTGVLTVGHAPAESMDELVRVTRPGGHLIFSLTVQTYEQDGFKQKLEALEAAGRCQPLAVTSDFVGLVAVDDEVTHPARFFVYRAL
ncbi:MAG: class I SAM-dependent methyltransferase [Alphaproteobacteria bacterium]|jgi:predicted TPR repeat methyltransferase|nr:class I SAM-dependent methyltransferase [Alphaproteobacteria bacterium]|tara:strand:+ start:703 stop:1344 length:642 start_codon:yes stop_codon:yes gene_type:complete